MAIPSLRKDFNREQENCLKDYIASYEAKWLSSVSLVCNLLSDKADPLFSWRSTSRHPAASLMKLFILGTVAKEVVSRRIDLSKEISVTRHVGGSGLLKYLETPIEISIRDALLLMMRFSDNMAANALLSLVSLDRVNEFIVALSAENTRMIVPMMPSTSEAARGHNYTTAEDILLFYIRVLGGSSTLISSATSEICSELLAERTTLTSFLTSRLNRKLINKIITRCPLNLPRYCYAIISLLWEGRLTGSVPKEQILAQKSATNKHLLHDSCVIRTPHGSLVMVLMIENQTANFYKKSSREYRDAISLHRRIGKLIWRNFR